MAVTAHDPPSPTSPLKSLSGSVGESWELRDEHAGFSPLLLSLEPLGEVVGGSNLVIPKVYGERIFTAAFLSPPSPPFAV